MTQELDPIALCVAADGDNECGARAVAGGHYCPKHAHVYLVGNEVGGFDEWQPAVPSAPRHDAEPHTIALHGVAIDLDGERVVSVTSADGATWRRDEAPRNDEGTGDLDPDVLEAQATTMAPSGKQRRFEFIPATYALYYPAMCETARDLGYALAIHGSMARDLDVVAVPWTDEAASPEDLVSRLVERHKFTLKQEDGQPVIREKPHGRRGWVLWFGGHFYVDLSVMPREVAAPPPSPGEEGVGALLDDVRSILDDGEGGDVVEMAERMRDAMRDYRARIVGIENALVLAGAPPFDDDTGAAVSRLAADNASLRAQLAAASDRYARAVADADEVRGRLAAERDEARRHEREESESCERALADVARLKAELVAAQKEHAETLRVYEEGIRLLVDAMGDEPERQLDEPMPRVERQAALLIRRLKAERDEVEATLLNFKLNGSNAVEQIKGIYSDLSGATAKIRALKAECDEALDGVRLALAIVDHLSANGGAMPANGLRAVVELRALAAPAAKGGA